jgi:hypothetical protein
LNLDTGEAQIKAFAEAFQVPIELTNAENLEEAPRSYQPQPTSTTAWDPVQIPPASVQPQRILLFAEHYYPLFPKGSFPHRRIFTSRSDVSPDTEETRIERNSDPVKGINKPDGDKLDDKLQMDDIPEVVESPKIMMTKDDFNAVDRLWDFVNTQQSTSVKIPQRIGDSPLKSISDNEKKLLPPSQQDPRQFSGALAIEPHRSPGRLRTVVTADKQIQVSSKPVPPLSRKPVAPLAIAAGVAAGLTGLFVLGATIVNIIMGKQRKKEPKKRNVDFTSEGVGSM